MNLVRLQDAEHASAQRGILATSLLEGNQSQVRLIRLAAGQALPPHRHGRSDLML